MSEIEYKIALIGDSETGKSCIFKKLIIEIFREKYIPTIGIDRKTLNIKFDINKSGIVENKNFNINLIDISGNEKFRQIIKGYFKSSDGILIIYDITNRQSFENVKMWINFINENIKDKNKCVIILIGNKLDLIEKENNLRKVKEEEAKEICSNNYLFWGGEISIKNIDINELKELFEVYIKKIYEKVGDKHIPKQRVIKIENCRTRRNHGKSCTNSS